MLGELYAISDSSKLASERAEKQARFNWRFRNHKSKEQIVLTSVVTSVLGLFLR